MDRNISEELIKSKKYVWDDNKYEKRKLSVFKINIKKFLKSISYWILISLYLILNLSAQFWISFKGFSWILPILFSMTNVILLSIISIIVVFFYFKKQIDDGYHSMEIRCGIKSLSSFWQRIMIISVFTLSPILITEITSMIIIIPSNIVEPSIYWYKIFIQYLDYIVIETLFISIFILFIIIFQKAAIVLTFPLLLAMLISFSPIITSLIFAEKMVNPFEPVAYTNKSTSYLETWEYYDYYVANSIYGFDESVIKPSSPNNESIFDGYQELANIPVINGNIDNYQSNPSNQYQSTFNIYQYGLFTNAYIDPELKVGNNFDLSILGLLINQMNQYLLQEYGENTTSSDVFWTYFRSAGGEEIVGENGPITYPEKGKSISDLFSFLSTKTYYYYWTSTTTNLTNPITWADDFLVMLSKLSENIEILLQTDLANDFRYDNCQESNFNWSYPKPDSIPFFPWEQGNQIDFKEVSAYSYGVDWFMMNAIRTTWSLNPLIIYCAQNDWGREQGSINFYINPIIWFNQLLNPTMPDSIDNQIYNSQALFEYSKSSKVYIPRITETIPLIFTQDAIGQPIYNEQVQDVYDAPGPIMDYIKVKEKTMYSPAAMSVMLSVFCVSIIVGSSYLYVYLIKK